MSRLADTKAARKWEEAYPLGNGRLGAMVFSQSDRERIQLNEDSIWYGCPVDRINPDTYEHLPQIQKLVLEGKIPEAEKQIKRYISGIPQSQRPYQSAGDLWISWDNSISDEKGYKRELDLTQAMVKTSSDSCAGKTFREYLISAPDQVMAIHGLAEEGKTLSCQMILTRGKYYETVEKCGNDTILMKASCGEDGVNLAIAVKAVAGGGSVEVAGEHLIIEDARDLTLYVAIETTFYLGEEGILPDALYGSGELPVVEEIKKTLRREKDAGYYTRRALKRVEAAARKGYEKIREDHIADYRQYFDRVAFTLRGEKEKQEVLDYTKTYFDYGRYLLISSSRPGTLPANLQGIWNDKMEPSWDSKYTININTEMNYWPAEVCDLSELHTPLFDLILRMAPRGKETARRMYGCRGMVAHHNTDIWADCAPQDIWISSAYWVMGAAWLCTHVKKHFDYTKDMEFLKQMYPVLKDTAIFFHDFLIEDHGNLVTCPSISPENTYIMENGTKGCVCAGASMDNQILRDFLSFYKDASEILGIEDKDTVRNKEILPKISGNQIGKYGQIMEWREDYDEEEPGHRHISQLYALHPSDQITSDQNPEFARAAAKTLERRLTYGGGHTGWSCAWIVNLFARLGEAEKAWENLKKLFEKSTFPNMMDNHPMFDYYVFQIDGNFGATAGITEMILQSNRERSVLLPALPDDWIEGSMNGLVLNGGAKADISWKNKELISCKITARFPFTSVIRYKDSNCKVELPKNGSCILTYGERGLSYELIKKKESIICGSDFGRKDSIFRKMGRTPV